MRRQFLVLLALIALAGPAHAVGPNNALNDTGVILYGDGASNTLPTEPATHPGQDARYGRDAAAAAGTLSKIGAGTKGFDFTKIANNGSVLPANAMLGTGATAWGCTYDNLTGLMWEVKVNDPTHLRFRGHTYTWYDTNSATNGGSAGTANGGSCHAAGRCDTAKFVQDVNAAGLCGHGDWRMPRVKELLSVADQGIVYPGPTIDSTYFPNTSHSMFWSASASADDSGYAWYVYFGNGFAYGEFKSDGYQVRLVRAGQ